MPNYVFECKNCNKVYEELVARWDETGKYSNVACPACGSKRKEQMATACGHMFSNPVGTGRWNSASTGHDYRYKTKQASDRDLREKAEKKSHMGSGKDIYKDHGDLNVDKNWDFDKI